MVHTNKILTVSYGTFSCTLEGFEDSFDTMKAIAEYFRDLAADDRYFGAEPPQPDADMLARIAQREVTRQVEAHSTDNGTIVLRAAAPVAAPVAPPAVEEPAAEPVAEVAPEPVSEHPAKDAAPEFVEPARQPEPETPARDDATEAAEVAAPLPEAGETTQAAEAAIDEVVAAEPAPEQVEARNEHPAETIEPAAAETETVAAEDAMVEDAIAEDAVAEDAIVEDSVAEDAVAEDAIVEDTATEDAAADDKPETEPAEIIVADTEPAETPVVEDPVASDILPDSTPQPVAAADSIAAKLQRIRAVVSQNDSLAQMDDYTEDQHADGFVAGAAEEIGDALVLDDEMAGAAEPEVSDDEVSQVLDRIDMQAETATDAVPGEPAPSPVADMQDDTGDSAESRGTEPVAETGTDDTAAPLPARVVKVKRAELDAAIASGQIEPVESAEEVTGDFADSTGGEDAGFFDPQDSTPESTLSPEDEADLMRELAAVEEELEERDENIFGEDLDVPARAPSGDTSAHAALQQTVTDEEEDLSRLMSEVGEKLEDPETSTRHETYSQLRAAVAVAEAERSAGGSVEDATEDEAYREDLAEVVRPRRPTAEGTRASRPAIVSRPAPLKLVAEQRVDDGADTANRGPIRPRRVMTEGAGTADSTGADSAFAEFAGRMGATELPDLLEAAAAYLSFVEGHDKFSRPQLMNKVRLIKQDGYNREDGLRSFGQLLRDGKIEKRGGGRFAASGEIGFQPDEREAG